MKCLVLALLAACAFPEKEVEGPFDCLGADAPSTANTQVTVSGIVIDARTAQPQAGATVAVVLATSVIVMTTADEMGNFAMSVNTGGIPLDAFIDATSTDHLHTYLFPPLPVTHDVQAVVELFRGDDLVQLGMLGGAPMGTPVTGKATLLVTVDDCNGKQVGGATLSASAGGNLIYFVGQQPTAGANTTDDMTGSALIFNVMPGTTQIFAMVNGMPLHTHPVVAMADAVVQTSIQP